MLKDSQVSRDFKVTLDSKVIRVLLVLRDLLEEVFRDILDIKDFMDIKVIPDSMVKKDKRVKIMVLLVKKVNLEKVLI